MNAFITSQTIISSISLEAEEINNCLARKHNLHLFLSCSTAYDVEGCERKRMEEEIICNRWKDLADETINTLCARSFMSADNDFLHLIL
jgi:hypothetical protein